MALTLTFGTADAWAKGNAPSPAPQEAPAQAVTETVPRPAPRTPVPVGLPGFQFDLSYAEREVAAAGLENFEGGDVVIIGSTGLVILLLVVIILLML